MDNIPEKVLGYSVKTRWQISLNYLIPCTVELLVYLTVMVVDSALVYQHLLDENNFYAWITLFIVITPGILTFSLSILSPNQKSEDANIKSVFKFIMIQLLYFLTFPIGATYRFARKIFWCVESLFHDKSTNERRIAISKSAETSQFELYHFLQSFFHCAPQIMFQLYIILHDDMFRNYDTSFVQAISIIFGLIKMSMSAESYQRFESQKIVGRRYPWQTINENVKSMREKSATETANTASNPSLPANKVTNQEIQTANDLNAKTHEDKRIIDFSGNITDDEKLNTFNNTDLNLNNEDLDIFDEVDKNIEDETNTESINLRNSHFQKTLLKPFDETIHRLSAMKNSFILRTESFIKEKIPRAPEHLFSHVHKENESENKTFLANTPDEADGIILPTRRKITTGIENDDIVAKFVAFLGWNFFLIMRLMSLSSFAVFHLDICGILCFFHYCLMLSMLINETRFKVRWQRTVFYTVLAYIFLFTLIEFKIKFKKVRSWYIFYFIIVFIQNIAMTISWYGFEEYLDSWWFEFIFLVIVQSGVMSLMCFLLYFFYLKPQDKLIHS